jgi:hypothetical protein
MVDALRLAEREVIAELVWREFNRFFRPCTDEDAAEWRGVQWHEPDVRVVADVVVELETRGTDEANWVHFHFYGDRVVHVRYTGLVHFNVQPAQLMAAAAARQAHAAQSPDESTDVASYEASDDEEVYGEAVFETWNGDWTIPHVTMCWPIAEALHAAGAVQQWANFRRREKRRFEGVLWHGFNLLMRPVASVFQSSQSLLVRWVDAWGCGGGRAPAWAFSGRGQLQQACGFTAV